MMALRHLMAGVGVALSFSAGAAQATTTFYTHSADFLAAIHHSFQSLSEGFETYAIGTEISNGEKLGDLTYHFSSARVGRVGDRSPHFDLQSLESSAGQFAPGDSITVTPPWHLHWFGLFISAGPLTTDSIFMDAFGHSSHSGSGGYDTGSFYFIGAITDEHDFNTVTFGMEAGGAPFNVDDFLFNRDPIPEPAAWTLMLTGFGLMGATIRNSRRRGALPI
jgi:hypothetical protein